VENLMGSQAYDTRSHIPRRKEWLVQSDVTDDVHRLFVSAVHDKAINLMNDRVDRPSVLCSEFRFPSLSHHSQNITLLMERFAYRKSDVHTVQLRSSRSCEMIYEA
jgi:hypothetical protein